jgi:hypothetical protein
MYKPIIVFAYLYLLFFSVSTFAQGDLYVTNRVILEGRKMNEVLSLANTGGDLFYFICTATHE